MVHIQHTAVASRAVMATLRLEDVTDKAIPLAFVVRVIQVEPLTVVLVTL